MTRWTRFVLLAIVLFLAHFALTTWAVLAWSGSVEPSRPLSARFAPAFAAALSTFPLYPIVGMKPALVVMAVLNSLVVAVFVAALIVLLRWRAILVFAIGIALLMGGLFIAGTAIERRVAAGFGKMPAETKENEASQRVRQLAEPFRLSDPATSETRSAISKYLSAETARADDAIDPPPQEVERYLVEHRWHLHELERHLVQNEIHFATDDHELLPLFALQKIILADALQQARSGDQPAAWTRIDAANRLTRPMADVSDVGVYVAIAATENQLGVARKLDPPAVMPIRRFDPHERAFAAFAGNAAAALRAKGEWFVAPYLRLAAAESAASELREARKLMQMRGCRFQEPPPRNAVERVPFNPFGVSGEGARLALRANRMNLDFEGTERILALKRGQPDERSMCSGRKWKFDGAEVRLLPEVPAKPPALPAFHRITPAARTQS